MNDVPALAHNIDNDDINYEIDDDDSYAAHTCTGCTFARRLLERESMVSTSLSMFHVGLTSHVMLEMNHAQKLLHSTTFAHNSKILKGVDDETNPPFDDEFEHRLLPGDATSL